MAPLQVNLLYDKGSAASERRAATVEQLLAMQVGDFIELARSPSITAHVDGVPIFECQYGTHKGKYALRVERNLRGIDMNWLGDSYVN